MKLHGHYEAYVHTTTNLFAFDWSTENLLLPYAFKKSPLKFEAYTTIRRKLFPQCIDKWIALMEKCWEVSPKILLPTSNYFFSLCHWHVQMKFLLNVLKSFHTIVFLFVSSFVQGKLLIIIVVLCREFLQLHFVVFNC